MDERTSNDLKGPTASTNAVRRQLEKNGDNVLRALLSENVQFLASASAVRVRFNILESTLRMEREAGRVIAYQSSADCAFVYPVEQFMPGAIASWAGEVISATANGSAALHFLYVPREQLGGESFASALREPRGRPVQRLIEETAARLAAE